MAVLKVRLVSCFRVDNNHLLLLMIHVFRENEEQLFKVKTAFYTITFWLSPLCRACCLMKCCKAASHLLTALTTTWRRNIQPLKTMRNNLYTLFSTIVEIYTKEIFTFVFRCWKWARVTWRGTCSRFTCCWPIVTSIYLGRVKTCSGFYLCICFCKCRL